MDAPNAKPAEQPQLPDDRAAELVRLGNLALYLSTCLRGVGLTEDAEALALTHKRIFALLAREAGAVAEAA